MTVEACGDRVLHIVVCVLVIRFGVDLLNLGFQFMMGVSRFGKTVADAGVAMMFIRPSRAMVFDFIGVRNERREGESSNSKNFFHCKMVLWQGRRRPVISSYVDESGSF